MIIAQIIVDLTLNNNYANKSITHYSHDITEILLKVTPLITDDYYQATWTYF